DLLDLISQEIKDHFFEYKDTCFFLKLEKSSDGKLCHIAWVKTFSNIKDYLDFFWDTEFQRACILIHFDKILYRIFCSGYYWSDGFQVGHKYTCYGFPEESSGTRESRKMLPRELLKGFGELTLVLKKSNGNMA